MTGTPAAPIDGESLPSAADLLVYADIVAPDPGHVTLVAEGVYWLRMPLPGELSHINLWLIEHDGGFIAVDTGMATNESRDVWEFLHTTLLKDRPLKLIFVTHLHPDHAGLAAWMQERFNVPVWTSQRTALQLQALFAAVSDEERALRTGFLASHGVSRDDAAPMFGEKFRIVVSGAPKVERYPQEGEEVLWGGKRWRFIEVGGHASGHLCLHAPENNLLISGDQVLPTISPNISLHEPRLDANPLSSYLDSLERLAQLDPQTLVLPSHGRPFYGLRPRALDIRDHHLAQLEKLRAAASAKPLTAEDALPVMFFRTLRGFHRFLAIGEALAHLEYLAAIGKLRRCVSDEGRVSFVAD